MDSPDTVTRQSILFGKINKLLPIIFADPPAECAKPHCPSRVLMDGDDRIIHQSIFGGERRKFLPIIAGDPTAACSKPHCAVSVLIHAPNTVRPQSIKRTVMLPGSFFEGSNAKVDVRERLTVFSV